MVFYGSVFPIGKVHCEIYCSVRFYFECIDAGVVRRKQFILVGEEADGATGLQSDQTGDTGDENFLEMIN